MKTILVEVAWAAIKKKGSYYKAKYYKLKSRRGAKKAIVAIAHRISKAIFCIIKNGEKFEDPGESYLLESDKKRNLKRLRRQAKMMGMELVAATV